MSLRLFNTFSKKEEEFVPLTEGQVTMYTCGPTVYGRPHIGNYSSFLMADLLHRWLEVSGYTVKHVENITDVGHLLADQDTGEDKVEAQAKKEKLDPLEIAGKYTEQYLEDEKALNMLEPDERPRATETIPEMITLIEKLVEKGCAYDTDDGVYFSVQSFPDYGKLSGNTLDKLGKLQTSPRLRPAGEKGVRVEIKETKKHPADFALWKKRVGEHEAHILHWDSPWGDGFPGWHIECSAMSMKFLGEQIDIHTGGEDNIFPHHECEIAQSECASGKPFVKYWLHKRRVNFSDDPSTGSGRVRKMSKSLGNVLTLPEITERGFDPLDLRYFFLSSHYRSHTQFTWKGLEDAKKARLKISEWMEEASGAGGSPAQDKGIRAKGKGKKEIESFVQKFTDAMNSDLNTPGALAVVFDCMAWSRNIQHSTFNIQPFTEILQKTFGCFQAESVEVPEDVQKLVNEREAARATGDYATSDKLRDEVKKRGFVLEDMPEGVKVVPRLRRDFGGQAVGRRG